MSKLEKDKMKKLSFSEEDKIKCLLWCNRHCCLCGKQCGNNIEIAHIIPKANRNIPQNKIISMDNAIPLCFNCHAEIDRYNVRHPRGNKYREEELKRRRNQIYDEQTQNLVPSIFFSIIQTRDPNGFPDVGFVLAHKWQSLPVKIKIKISMLLGTETEVFPFSEYYNGEKLWNLNPNFEYYGHFSVPDKANVSKDRLELRVHTEIIDQYERQHHLLPVGWVCIRNDDPKQVNWYLEP